MKCRKEFIDPKTGKPLRTYLVNLRTSDLKIACQRRDELEAETSAMFGDIKAGRTHGTGVITPAEQGRFFRETLATLDRASDGPDDATEYDVMLTALDGTAESFHDEDDRVAFFDALDGREGAADHLEAYLSAADFAPKTRNERRGNLGRFVKWAAAQNPPLTLDRIDRKQAGKYVTAVIDPMHPATQKKHLSALRGYWRWLAARGHVTLPLNAPLDAGWPWDGQQVRRRGKRIERGDHEKERPFSDDEARALLYGPDPKGMAPSHIPAIRDALRISMLSGMRQAEILTLWVEEVKEDPEGGGMVFDIQKGKTDAAARPVPVHPDLVEIVQRRLAGKGGKEWLFHELARLPDPADTFGKRFRRYRLAFGINDMREGRRRSLVNFHSARRWFSTAADRAGQYEDVIGHVPDKKDVTRHSYIARSSGAQMRACVEAVKLPARV